jgi:hypothetical protein
MIIIDAQHILDIQGGGPGVFLLILFGCVSLLKNLQGALEVIYY